MFDVFSDRKTVQKLAKENMTLTQKIRSVLDRTLSCIEKGLKALSLSGKAEEVKALIDEKDKLAHIRELMAEGLEQAKKNRAEQMAGQKNNTAEAVENVLFSVKQFTLSENDIRQNILLVGDMENVVNLTGNEFEKGSVNLTDQVDSFFAKYNYSIENPDIGDVEVNRRGAKDSIAHGIGRIKATSFAAVPYTIEKGKIIDYQKNWKGRQYDTIVLSAPISIDNERYYQGVIVIRDVSTQRFYLHEVLTEKEGDTSFKTGAGAKHTPGDVSPSLISLLKKVRDVNSNSMQKNDVDYSTKKDIPLEAVFGFYSDVVRENKAWSLLNNMLEILTNSARTGIHLRRKDIETVAKKLIKDNSSTMTVEELTE